MGGRGYPEEDNIGRGMLDVGGGMSTRTLGHRPTFDLTTRSAPVCTSASAISHYRFYLTPTRSVPRAFIQPWTPTTSRGKIARRRHRLRELRSINYRRGVRPLRIALYLFYSCSHFCYGSDNVLITYMPFKSA